MSKILTSAFGLLALALLAACGASHAATTAPRLSPSPRPSATATATPATPTATPSPTKPPTPTATPSPTPTPCAARVCVFAGHFVFNRPLPREANNRVSPTYRFESTYRGKRPPHHGVDFENPLGMPVLAAADGVVVFAGDDLHTRLGLFSNFYGQAVVLKHNIAGIGAVYTLYGHVEQVLVHVGQKVRAGEQIATVGSRGVAIGPHLHFEVRVGENEYGAAKNPWLWLKPLKATEGVLAVRLTEHGVSLRQHPITVTAADGTSYYIRTYAEGGMGDPVFRENAVLGDLPVGEYTLTTLCCGRLLHLKARVEAQKLTLVRWELNP